MRCASGGSPALEPAIEHAALEHGVDDKALLIHGWGRYGPHKSCCVPGEAEEHQRSKGQPRKGTKHAHENSLRHVAGIMAQE